MKYFLIIISCFFCFNLYGEESIEIKDFAEKYLDNFQDKFSYKYFKVIIDVDDSEVLVDKEYGTFKYKFDKDTIDNGEMIIEKKINNISFQLKNDFGNTLFVLQYKIKLK